LEFKDGKLIAGNAYKQTKFGLKLVFVATNGKLSGKIAGLKLIKDIGQSGYYAELSGPTMAVAKKLNINKVNSNTANLILNKHISPFSDGFTYEREVTRLGRIQKVMFGKPNFI
jgi:hypothetical protein